jgi:hypothetical protein
MTRLAAHGLAVDLQILDNDVSVTCSAIAWLGHDKRIIHLFSTRLLNYGGLDP